MEPTGGRRQVAVVDGMRLNDVRAIREWVTAGRKLAAMVDRLEADPDSGFPGYQPAFMGVRTGAASQHWRSLADLKRFAHDREDLHVPAWRWYEDEVDDGGVGFWAELYVVGADDCETFYRNVPPIGLGVAAELVSADDRRRRLGFSDDGAAPVDDSSEA